SERRYYRYILERLVREEVIDLGEAAQLREERQPERMPFSGKPGYRLDSDREEDHAEHLDAIYIVNAGLVLASPYLPQLFKMVDLTEGGKFRNAEAAERAIHLLQFAVNESCDSPEFLLPLNKILCGVATWIPIEKRVDLLPRERDAVEGMLAAMIRSWTIIGNTSVRGLRESFLQRGGRLQLKEDAWHLKVEQKGIDVLLDRLPWSFSIIRHPWMIQPIYVEWR
ncbi:MAG: contractile injection system tape measure protein, partial [Burkholderiales bacterium]